MFLFFVDEISGAGATNDASPAPDAGFFANRRQRRVLFVGPDKIDRVVRAFSTADRAFLLIVEKTIVESENRRCDRI